MPEIEVEPERAAAFLAQLGREADTAARIAEKKTADTEAKLETAGSAPESWLTFAERTVDFTDRAICPAWELTGDEKGHLSQSIAEVLDYYFPGAVEGFDEWSPLAKLAGTLFFIAALRIDYQTWKLQPLRISSDESEPERRGIDPDDGHDPERQNAGQFKTHGD